MFVSHFRSIPIMNYNTNAEGGRYRDVDFYTFSGLRDLDIESVRHLTWFAAFPRIDQELRVFFKRTLDYYSLRKHMEGGVDHLWRLPLIPDYKEVSPPSSNHHDESPASPDSVIMLDDDEDQEDSEVIDGAHLDGSEGNDNLQSPSPIYPDYSAVEGKYSSSYSPVGDQQESPSSPLPSQSSSDHATYDSEPDEGQMIVSPVTSPLVINTVAPAAPASPPYESPLSPPAPSVSLFIDEDEAILKTSGDATSEQDEYLEPEPLIVEDDDVKPSEALDDDDDIEFLGEQPPAKKRRRRQRRSSSKAKSESSSSSPVLPSSSGTEEVQMQKRMEVLQEANRAVEVERELSKAKSIPVILSHPPPALPIQILPQQSPIRRYTVPPPPIPAIFLPQPHLNQPQPSPFVPFSVPPPALPTPPQQLTRISRLLLNIAPTTNPFGPGQM